MREIEMIESIPRFECSDGSPLMCDNDFYKSKLKNALHNDNIICLSRGEARSQALNEIVFHPEILFDWGEKSIQAFQDNQSEEIRRFCEPGVIDKPLLIHFIKKYIEGLNKHYRGYNFLRCKNEDINIFREELITKIEMENDNEKLLIIKEWLIYALHTMQEEEFKFITPCISCTYGEHRFDVAKKFGRGNKQQRRYYVIMDCWIEKDREGIAYRKVTYVNEVLKQYKLKWHKDINYEIMLKFAIFPQRLVGYYVVEDDKILKYVLNKHYVAMWNENTGFEIGEPVYIDQIIDFNKIMPYKTVYMDYGHGFSIAGKRR